MLGRVRVVSCTFCTSDQPVDDYFYDAGNGSSYHYASPYPDLYKLFVQLIQFISLKLTRKSCIDMSRYSDRTSGEANRTPEELSKHFIHHNQQYHDTPKGTADLVFPSHREYCPPFVDGHVRWWSDNARRTGYRHEPHNTKEVNYEQRIYETNPEGGHYKERASDSRRPGGKFVPEASAPSTSLGIVIKAKIKFSFLKAEISNKTILVDRYALWSSNLGVAWTCLTSSDADDVRTLPFV